MQNIADGYERADDRKIRRALCSFIGVVLAVATIGVLAAMVAGDAVMPMFGGLVFGFAFLRTRSIVTPWFLHGLADWALLNDTIGTFLLRQAFG